MNLRKVTGALIGSAIFGYFVVLLSCQGLLSHTNVDGIQAGITSSSWCRRIALSTVIFGQLPAYWKANGYPQANEQRPFDGIPANATNPSYDGATSVAAFHLATECIQQLTPSWNESRVDWNRRQPTSPNAAMDGFVYNAAVPLRIVGSHRHWIERT